MGEVTMTLYVLNLVTFSYVVFLGALKLPSLLWYLQCLCRVVTKPLL